MDEEDVFACHIVDQLEDILELDRTTFPQTSYSYIPTGFGSEDCDI